MDFQSILRLLDVGVQRDDLTDLSKYFVNQALHDIMVRRSWSCMRNLKNVTLLNGTSTVNMPDDFKEFTREKFPIAQSDGDGGTLPCYMYTLDQLTRLRSSFGELISVTSGRQRKLSIYTNVDDGQWYMGLPPGLVALEDLTFRVSYYRFLTPLEADGDENDLTKDYGFMVLNRAKSIAFSSVNDAQWKECEGMYENEYIKNAASDARRSLAGLNIRM